MTRPSTDGSHAARARPVWPGLLVVLCAAILAVPVRGQDPEADPPPTPVVRSEFGSPAATLRTFVTAMSDGDLGRAVACLDLSAVENEGEADRALELYRAINRLDYLDFERDPALVDASSQWIGQAETWTFFPREIKPSVFRKSDRERAWRAYTRFADVAKIAPDAQITLARMPGGEWRFSAETVRGSRELWERLKAAKIETVEELAGTDQLRLWERFESLWPETFVLSSFLRVKYWQWITLFLVILAGIVLDYATRAVVTLISVRAIRRRGGEAKRETLRRTVRPFGLAAAAILWMWAIRLLGLPDEALRVLIPAVKLFLMLAMVWSAYRVTDLLGEVAQSRAATTDTRFDDVLVPLVRKALKVFITVFGLIYIADSLNVPIAPLLTGLGIGGAGFAFAAKDTLEHLFGSVTVIADRPFEVGDWVQIGDVEGTVEELGFRSTRVRTFYNSLVTVPNGNLVRAVVDNFGRRKYRRWSTHVNVTYDTPPDRLEAFCEGIREIIRRHPYTRKDYYQVWLHKFGAHSLDVLLYIFFETPDWNTELRERHRLMMDIIRLAAALKVEFAFPTQTLHLHRDARGEEEAASSPPDTDADRRARAIGRRAVRALTADAAWRHEKPPPYVFEYADDTDEDTQIESKVGGSA